MYMFCGGKGGEGGEGPAEHANLCRQGMQSGMQSDNGSDQIAGSDHWNNRIGCSAAHEHQSLMNYLSSAGVGGFSGVTIAPLALATDVHLPKIMGATCATTCHSLSLPAAPPL